MKNVVSLHPAHAAPGILARLEAYSARADRAYSDATKEAWKNDSAKWTAWCQANGRASFPAAPVDVAAWVEALGETHAVASIDRYLSTLAHMHRAAGLASPTRDELVRLAFKVVKRQRGVAQRQALGLTWELRRRMIHAWPDTAKGRRDKAMLALSYDGMLRRSELVAADWEHIDRGAPDGSGTLFLPRSKTDQEGAGAYVWLAPDTLVLLDAWAAITRQAAGPIFRAFEGARPAGRLSAGRVNVVFKAMAAAALSAEAAAQVTGHSGRVGATQDMMAAGIDLGSIMNAGRWKSPDMPNRYTRHLPAGRSGMAKLAVLQNRT